MVVCFQCVVWMASAQKTNPVVNGILQDSSLLKLSILMRPVRNLYEI